MISDLQWRILTTLINEDKSWIELRKELKCQPASLSEAIHKLESGKILETYTAHRDSGPGRKTGWTARKKSKVMWKITELGRELIQNGQLGNHL